MSVHIFELGECQALAYRFKVNSLATDHAAMTTCVGQLLNHGKPRWSFYAGRLRQPLKCQCLQGIAGKNSCSLIKGNMGGWPASTQFVVVHGRQVVMNKGISVDQLDRTGRYQRDLHVLPQSTCSGQT